MNTENITINNGVLAGVIKSTGAELCSLRSADDKEWMWQGTPDVWARHAPVLFPIVGRLRGDGLIFRGKSYPMTQHGFARDSVFMCERAEPHSVTFFLTDNELTRQHYPFAFKFAINYTLKDKALWTTFAVTNTGDEPLPFSIGAHPAFIWPAVSSVPRERHTIKFACSEQAPIRRLQNGLLVARPFQSPVKGQTLTLRDSLFKEDAVIFDQLVSKKVSYCAAGKPIITLSYADFPNLGLWTKPGAGFVCIEPWQGFASPVSFAGEFTEKPGVVRLAPQATRSWRYAIEVHGYS